MTCSSTTSRSPPPGSAARRPTLPGRPDFDHFAITATGIGPGTHGLNTEWLSSGNVWSRGDMHQGTFDSHRAGSFDYLRTDILCANTSNSNPGGASQAGPFTLRRVAHWNNTVTAACDRPAAERGIWISYPDQFVNSAMVGTKGADTYLQPASWGMPGGAKNCLVLDAGLTPQPGNLYDAQVEARQARAAAVSLAIPGFTSPRDLLLAPGNIALQATAHAAHGRATGGVSYYVNGTLLGTRHEAPYAFTWADVAPGEYTLTLRLTDTGANETWSLPYRVVVGHRVRLEEDHPALNYTGSWAAPSLNRTCSAGGYRATSGVGAAVRCNFRGTRLRLLVKGDSTNNGCKIYVDDMVNPVAVWSRYYLSDMVQDVVFDSGPLPATDHTVKFVNEVAGQSFWLDAIEIESTADSVVSPQQPLARFTPTATEGNLPFTVHFNASSSTDDGGIVAYTWDFGDGSTGSGATPSHTYTTRSNGRPVVLTVMDAQGHQSRAYGVVEVRDPDNQAPVAAMDATPRSGPAPLAVTFRSTGSLDSDGTVTTYEWDFGDGSTSNTAHPTHTYQNPGYYEARLRVLDEQEKHSAWVSQWILVEGYTPRPGVFQESGGLVVMEAENFQANTPASGQVWNVQQSPAGYSGTATLFVGPADSTGPGDPADNTARTRYRVNFTQTGTYRAWILGGNGDSIHLGLDGVGMTYKMQVPATAPYSWRSWQDNNNAPLLTVGTAGEHEVNLWVRLGHPCVDKILLTRQTNYTPVGTGPAESGFVAANQYPTVSLSAPADASVYDEGQSVTITATPADGDGPISRVEFYQGNTKLGEDISDDGGWSFTWADLPAGRYTLSAVATDHGGLATRSAPVVITVAGAANTPPTASILSPAHPHTMAQGDTLTVTATAADPDGTVAAVEFHDNGLLLHTDTDGSNGWSQAWVPAAGSHQLRVRATDHKGLQGAMSAIVQVTVTSTITVHLTAPAGNAQYHLPATVFFEASASDSVGTITHVEFHAGSTKLGQDTNGADGWTLAWEGPGAGIYQVFARATNSAGQVADSALVTITVSDVSNSLPTATLASPAAGTVFTLGTPIHLTATAGDSDGSVLRVEFYRAGSTLIGQDSNGADGWSYAWTTAPVGSHSLTARAVDNGNGHGTSAPVAIGVTSQVQSPWGGTARALPGRIEAEDYDLGGQGLAYHDTTPGNQGGGYRADDVDVAPLNRATVLQWGGNYVGANQNYARGYTTIQETDTDLNGNGTTTDFLRYTSFSAATPLSPATNYTGPVFYGGWAYWRTDRFPEAQQIGIHDGGPADYIRLGSKDYARANAVLYFSKAQFTQGGATKAVRFDGSSTFTAAIQALYGGGTPNSRKVRLLVHNADGYFLSQASLATDSTAPQTFTVANLGAQGFAAYSLAEGSAAFPFTGTSFPVAGSAFTDVRGVGLYFESTASGGGVDEAILEVSSLNLAATVDLPDLTGTHVTDFLAGEWVEHSATVTAGHHAASFRLRGTGSFQFLQDGTTLLAGRNVAATDWTTVSVGNLAFAAGASSVLRFEVLSGGLDFDWMEFTAETGSSPGTLTLAPDSPAVIEGNSGSRLVTFTVSRSNGTEGAVSVTYSTSDGTATAGSDYTAASGTLHWAAGENTDQTFTVTVAGDSIDEPDETVLMALSSPTNGAVLGSPGGAVLTITNDDSTPPPTFLEHPAHQSVPAGQTASFHVHASGLGTLTYQWQRSTDGGASYAPIPGATLPSYTTPVLSEADHDTRYRCVVTASGLLGTETAAIVHWGGDYVAAKRNFARALSSANPEGTDLDGDGDATSRLYYTPFSTITPLSPTTGYGGTSAVFYGGFLSARSADDRLPGFSADGQGIIDQGDADRIGVLFYDYPTTTAPFLWLKPDFLAGTGGPVRFSESSSFSLVITDWESGDNANPVFRLLVRSGDSYYLSQSARAFADGTGTFTIGNLAVQRFATYSLTEGQTAIRLPAAPSFATAGADLPSVDGVGFVFQATGAGGKDQTRFKVSAVQISALVATGAGPASATSNAAILTVLPPAYDTWTASQGLVGDQALPEADPDQDGLVNLLEFAFQADPRQADAELRPRSRPVEGGEGHRYLEISYRQRTGGTGSTGLDYTADGITYRVEVSHDLAPGSWLTGSARVAAVGTPVDLGDGVQLVTVRVLAPLDPALPAMARLVVTRP